MHAAPNCANCSSRHALMQLQRAPIDAHPRLAPKFPATTSAIAGLARSLSRPCGPWGALPTAPMRPSPPSDGADAHVIHLNDEIHLPRSKGTLLPAVNGAVQRTLARSELKEALTDVRWWRSGDGGRDKDDGEEGASDLASAWSRSTQVADWTSSVYRTFPIQG